MNKSIVINGGTDADKRRIAACVNACEGIPTEDLEKAQTPQRENLTRFGLACQQRDELLDILESIVCHERIENKHRLEAARSAIDRARS